MLIMHLLSSSDGCQCWAVDVLQLTVLYFGLAVYHHSILMTIWGPSPQKGHSPPLIFSACLFWPNGWMDQDATWYRGRPQPRRHYVRWGPSSPTEGATAVAHFLAHIYVAKWLLIAATAELLCCMSRRDVSSPNTIGLLYNWPDGSRTQSCVTNNR